MPKDKQTETIPSPTLEELILSLQKSVARTSEITSATSKYDSGFLLGDRSVYHVKELDIELSAAFVQDLSGRIQLNLNAPAEERSKLTFRIEPQIYQKIEGPSVVVSKFRSLSSDLNRLRQKGMIWVINELGRPEPKYAVRVFLCQGGMNAKEMKIDKLKTDVSGKLKFIVDAEKKTLHFDGQKDAVSIPFSKTRDWYMWATVEVDTDKDQVMETLQSEIIQIYYL